MANAAEFFAVELPAAVANDVTGEDVTAAARLPVLSMLGTASGARFAEAAAIVRSWFPSVVEREVGDATHLLVAQRPDAVAAHLQAFWRDIAR